jgi:hypothetical protein
MFPVQPLARIEHMTPRRGYYCIDVERREGAIRDDFQILQENGAMMSFIWDVTVHFRIPFPKANSSCNGICSPKYLQTKMRTRWM